MYKIATGLLLLTLLTACNSGGGSSTSNAQCTVAPSQLTAKVLNTQSAKKALTLRDSATRYIVKLKVPDVATTASTSLQARLAIFQRQFSRPNAIEIINENYLVVNFE